jgi:hypothetical protein
VVELDFQKGPDFNGPSWEGPLPGPFVGTDPDPSFRVDVQTVPATIFTGQYQDRS